MHASTARPNRNNPLRNGLSVLALSLMLFGALPPSAIAAGSSYGSSNSESRDNDPLADAKKAIGAKRYEDAIALLEDLRTASPDDADIFNLLGFSHRKLGQFDLAFEHYQTALTLDPDHIRAHEYLGELYLQTDRLAEAEQQLVRVNELCPLICKERRMLRKAIKQYKTDKP